VRVLLDTNVVVAAFVARGRCSELFEHCALEHELVTSEPLIEELSGALKELELSERDVVRAVRLYRRRARLATPAVLDQPVCRDPDDDLVLATAVGGPCRCIVTGDKDLLVVGRFRGIEILRPAQFWEFELTA